MRKNILWVLVIIIISLLSVVSLLRPVQAVQNAAAAYCLRLNELYGNGTYGYYNYTIQHTSTGDKSICIMPNGTALDAWEFFAGNIGQNYSICAKQGHGMITALGGAYASEQAICLDICIKQGKGEICGNIPAGKVAEINMSDNTGDIGSCIMGGCPLPVPLLNTLYNPNSYSSWDWRNPPNGTVWNKINYPYFDDDNGWLSPIKDQGTCTSCWAFGTAAAVETRYKLEQNESLLNPDLSEQYLLSCSDAGNCQTGGDRFEAFNYTKISGISDESCFPYTYQQGQCSRCQNYQSRLWKIDTRSFVEAPSVIQIKNFTINYGPVSIIMNWTGEIKEEDNCIFHCSVDPPDPNAGKHIVLIVGYKDTGNSDTSYWIAKNSFSENWPGGNCAVEGDGYFRLGFDTSEHNCNLGTIIFAENVIEPSYGPFVKLNNPPNNTNVNSQPVNFNFTAYTRVASKATCELVVNDTVRNMSEATNKTSQIFKLTLNQGVYNWKIRCWEAKVGIVNTSETRILTISQPIPPDNTAPTFSQASVNDTTAGKTTSFEILWDDTVALHNYGQYIFSFDNCVGSFTNDSTVNFTITPQELGIQKILSTTVGCTVKWQVFAKDNAGNWASTPIYSFSTLRSEDVKAPTHSLGSSNNTVIGNLTNFQITWDDDTALKSNGQYIFSFDNCTGFVNDSTVNFTNATSQTLGILKVISKTIGCKIQWRVFAKDNASNWNSTPIYSFFTSEKQEALSLVSFSEKIGSNVSLISFRYNKEVNVTMRYGKSKRYVFNVTNSTFLSQHSFMMPNLESNTTYYYDLIVCDKINVCEEKASSFKTLIFGSKAPNMTNPYKNESPDVPPEQNCSENQKKCSADNKLLWTCKNSTWESETCEESCKNNRCYSESAGFQFAFPEINFSSFIVPLVLVIIVSILIVVVVIILIRKKS